MSSYGLIGLAVGLAFAAIDYLVLLPLVERPHRAGMQAAPSAEKEGIARRIALLRSVFLWQFVVFPVLGYLVGWLVWG